MIETLEKIEEHLGKMLLGFAERDLDTDQLKALVDAARLYLEIAEYLNDRYF